MKEAAAKNFLAWRMRHKPVAISLPDDKCNGGGDGDDIGVMLDPGWPDPKVEVGSEEAVTDVVVKAQGFPTLQHSFSSRCMILLPPQT